MKKQILLLIAFFTFSVNAVNAQLTPQQALVQMGKGINLGNTLEPPLEGGWNNPAAEEVYFDYYLNSGFKTIRIPVRWDEHMSKTYPYTINSEWMDRVEEVVDWGLSRGLFIIINAHHEDWFKIDYATQSTRDRFDALWTQVSERFKDKSENLFFEIVNEPRTGDNEGLTQSQLDELNQRILDIIRIKNPTRITIYGGKAWSNTPDLLAAKIPEDDYIMGYFHSYDPWDFAGEGNGSWGTDADKLELQTKFTEVKDWASTNNVAVIISEFGAASACDYNSKMRHYAAYTENCINSNIAFMAWDDGGNFGILDRSTGNWTDVKDILIYNTPESPTNITATLLENAQINIEWENRASDYDELVLERRVNSGDFAQIGTIEANATSYIDTDVTSGAYYYYRIIAKYNSGTQLYSYPTRIHTTPRIQKPYGSVQTVPGTVYAENYDEGGEGLSYHETTEENIPGEYRPNEGVDIEARTTGGYQVGYVEAGEWIEYSINVAKAGTYNISLPIASMDGGGSFRFVFQNTNSSTMFAPKTSSWQTQSSVSTEVELEAGEQIMKLEILNTPGFNIDKFIFTEVTAIDDVNMQDFNIYPNPIKGDGSIHIKLNTQIKENSLQCKLYDANGKLIYEHVVDAYGADIELDINSDVLVNGIYFLHLKSENFNSYKKLIVE